MHAGKLYFTVIKRRGKWIFGVFNIAFMRLFRESKGNTAYTIVESDDLVPEDIADTIRRNKNVYNVMVVQM